MNRARAWLPALIVALSATAFAASGAAAASGAGSAPQRWDTEVLERFATLPVQEGGRIKPLSTLAGFRLLKFQGKRSWTGLGRLDAPRAERLRFSLRYPQLGAVEWLLDTLYYPEQAAARPLFQVQVSEVLDAIGVPHRSRHKRDRYSYMDLLPGRARLMELARTYSSINARERTPVQEQIVHLAHNLIDYEDLLSFLDFARAAYPMDATPALEGLFPEGAENRFSTVLANGPVLAHVVATLHGEDAPERTERIQAELNALERLLGEIDMAGAHARALVLFPPTGTDVEDGEEWLSPGDLVLHAFTGERPPARQVGLAALLEDTVRHRDDPARFRETVAALHDGIVGMAEARGEYRHVRLEDTFYRQRFFGRSLPLYVLCFVLVAFTWLRPDIRAFNWAAIAALLVPTAMVIVGITLRCIIRGRPPVTTLYETILFTTVVAVAVSIILELMNREKIGVSLGAFLGALGMFLANKYEAKEGVDTMPSLVAVLDTNFWLATHVTTIVMGYAAGLFASAISHVYIVGKLFRVRRDRPAFYTDLTRMTYGVLCFGLLFAVLGTVLGGIWANESWGRFWGWDPKENGALLIVLWMLTVLHARHEGYIRDLGVNISAVLCGMVVAFSWWGVNLLGVGLHSYGFTSGIFRVLVAFYLVEALVAGLGMLVWLRERGAFVPDAGDRPAQTPGRAAD